MDMKKQIMSFLLAASLVLGSAASTVLAQEEKVGAEALCDSSSADEKVLERTGYNQPIFLELEPEELPEIYKESSEQTTMRSSAVYQTAWDSYSTNYYYNLLNDDQRDLWDKLDRMCYEYLTGTESLTGVRNFKDPRQGLDVNYYTTKRVIYYNMSTWEAQDVEFMFLASNPQYYFLQILMGAQTTGTAGTAYLTIDESFGNGSARKAATQRMQNVINSWLPQINAQPNDLLKEKKIHDLICDKVIYDPYYGSYDQNRYNQTAYSVFCTDTTVCAGYSQAMQLLCNAVGIDCGVVTSSNHEWNIVRLNDTWYYTDLTWNDLPEEYAEKFGQGMVYDYFNRSERVFMADEAEAAESHTPEQRWIGYLPELVYDSGAKGTEHGTIYTPTATLNTPQISSSGSTVSISASPGVSVYYTTDGTNPSIAFTKAKKYRYPFALAGTTTVKAIAVRNGHYDSQVTGVTIVPKYNVVFQANGGYMSKKSIKSTSKTGILYNSVIGVPKAAKRKGYAFLGWYTRKSGGSKLGSSVKVTSDTVYYAHWAKINTKKKTKIGFVKNSASKAMKIKIKGSDTVSGYQIRYSLNKNMSSSRKKEASADTFTVKKLKKGKTYYVQARMYQKESVSGKKKYGPWSIVKTVKIKK